MDTLKLSTDLQADLIATLSSQAKLANMLAMVVNRTALALKASACTIFVVDRDRQTATQLAGTGYQARFVNKGIVSILPAEMVPGAAAR